MKITEELRYENGKKIAILRLVGRLTIGHGDSELSSKVYVLGDHNIVLDLSQVTLIDSAGLLSLIGARNKLAQNKRSLVLLNPSSKLDELLRFTDFIPFSNIFFSEDKALASFK